MNADEIWQKACEIVLVDQIDKSVPVPLPDRGDPAAAMKMLEWLWGTVNKATLWKNNNKFRLVVNLFYATESETIPDALAAAVVASPPASPQSENWRKLAVDYLACICVPPCDLTTNEPCWRCATRWALIAAADACDRLEHQNKMLNEACDRRSTHAYATDNAKLRELLATARDIAENATHDAWSFPFTRIKLSELKDAIDAALEKKL